MSIHHQNAQTWQLVSDLRGLWAYGQGLHLVTALLVGLVGFQKVSECDSKVKRGEFNRIRWNCFHYGQTIPKFTQLLAIAKKFIQSFEHPWKNLRKRNSEMFGHPPRDNSSLQIDAAIQKWKPLYKQGQQHSETGKAKS